MKKAVRSSMILMFLMLTFSACGSTELRSSESESSVTVPDTAQSQSAEETVPTSASLTESTSLTAIVTASESTIAVDDLQSNPDDIYDSTGFVSVSDVVPDVILEMRYYSTYNFVGKRINGYEEPVALLSKEAATALSHASDELRGKGYRLKIFDAYRPQSAVDHFAAWASDVDDTKMKEYFYPEIDKSNLFDYGYIAYHSGHSRGCTVDLTLLDMKTGKEIDMGGSFDYFGELSHPDYQGITEEQYNNRMILRNAMINNGFRACATEWWDFTLLDEPYPETYFSFPVKSLNK